jgi:hypothetical protein
MIVFAEFGAASTQLELLGFSRAACITKPWHLRPKNWRSSIASLRPKRLMLLRPSRTLELGTMAIGRRIAVKQRRDAVSVLWG